MNETYRLEVLEVEAAMVRGGNSADRLTVDLPERIGEAILRVAAEFDSALCDSCYDDGDPQVGMSPTYQPIGWHLDDTDVGLFRAGFIPFWVVDDGERTWTACEDCSLVLYAPSGR